MTSWVQRFGSNEVKVIKQTSDNKAYLRVTNNATDNYDVVNKAYLDSRVIEINTKILSVQTLLAGSLNYPNSYYVISSETYDAINGDLGINSGVDNMDEVTESNDMIELDIIGSNEQAGTGTAVSNDNKIRMYKSIQAAIKAAYKAHESAGHETVADANPDVGLTDSIVNYQVPRIILLSGVHNVTTTIHIPNYYYSTGTPSQPFDVEIMGESNTNNTIVNFNSQYTTTGNNTWVDGFRSYAVTSSLSSDDNLTASDQYLIAQDHRKNSIKFRNLSIHGAKWGIYALCNYLSVEDCKFYNCGWSGEIYNSGTYNNSADFFYGSGDYDETGSNVSKDPSDLTGTSNNTLTSVDGTSKNIVDGGGIFFNSRIIDENLEVDTDTPTDGLSNGLINDDANVITNISSSSNTSAYKNRKNNSIKNNIFNYNNEGIHILHSMNMEISNNKFCKNMGKCITNKYSFKTQINENFIEACFNTSIMLLNCFKTSIMDNNIYDVWNCGICCISSTHTLIQNNNLTDINERSYNGYGNGYTGYTGILDYDNSNGNHLIGDGSIVIKGKTLENANYWVTTINTNSSGVYNLLHRDKTEALTVNGNYTINTCIMNNNTLVRGGRGTNTTWTVGIALLEYGTDNKINLPIVINNFNANTPIYDNSGTDDIDTTSSTLIDVKGFDYESSTNGGTSAGVYLIINNCLTFLYKATIEKTDRDGIATNNFGNFAGSLGSTTDIDDLIVLNDNNIQPQ